MAVLLFLLVPVAILGAILLGHTWVERRRARALESLAPELDMVYSRTSPELLGELDGFHLTSKGDLGSITNVLRGRAAATEAIVLDYEYTGGDGKNSASRKQTVLCFRSEALALPAFSLRPKTFEHRVAHWLGFQAITLIDQPGFTDRWLLRGKGGAALRSLFRPDVIEFLDPKKDLCIEGRDHLLLIYREGIRVQPAMVQAFLEEGRAILALWSAPAG